METHQHQHQQWCAGSRTNRQADAHESADGTQVPLNEPAQQRDHTSGGRSGGPHHLGFAVQLHQRLRAAALGLRRGAVLLGLVRVFYGRQLLLLLLQPAGDVLARARAHGHPPSPRCTMWGMSCRGGNTIFREETTQFKRIEPQARRASKVVDGRSQCGDHLPWYSSTRGQVYHGASATQKHT